MKCQRFSKKMLNSLSHKMVDFHTSHKGFTLIELLMVTLFRKSPDGQVGINSHKKGFTLIELLIVIGILAVLATVTLLVLNPAQMFAEARDASRISDMDTINKALLYYQGVGGTNLGLTNKVYISIPSSYTNCSDLSLPALGNGYEYVCSDQAHYRNVDGTGWIPVNFTSTQGTLGALLTSLPVDPVNTVPNGFYYTYISGSWALSATMESQKYLSEKAPSDGGSVSTRFEVGNEIALDSIAGLGSGGAVCGNNTKETGETCDGTDLGGATCASVLGTGYTGTLSCNTGCSSFVTTSCVAPWTCGNTLTDSRNSKTYPTVLIGTQCWMAANMDYDNGCSTKTWVNSTDVGWCGYYNGVIYPNEGLLYQWSAAMNGSASCNGTGAPPNDVCSTPVQGVCPTGWHIPSHYEFTTLERAVCTSTTCSTNFPYDTTTTGWLGTNEGTNLQAGGTSGFNDLLAGTRETSNGVFYNRLSNSFIWSSVESGGNAWRRTLGGATVLRDASQNKADGYSVRCLKN